MKYVNNLLKCCFSCNIQIGSHGHKKNTKLHMYFKRLSRHVLKKMVHYSYILLILWDLNETPPACFNNDDILLSVGPQCWSLGADQEGNRNSSDESRPDGFISTHHQLKSVTLRMCSFICLHAVYLCIYLFIINFIYWFIINFIYLFLLSNLWVVCVFISFMYVD